MQTNSAYNRLRLFTLKPEYSVSCKPFVNECKRM
nr:MAG TPA: hypothetical protein [Caudoviricetes sp.]